MSPGALDSSVRALVTACQQLYAVLREKLLSKARRPAVNGSA